MTLKRQTDQWADIDGNKLRFWMLGQAKNTIFLLHGMGCSCLEWSENIEKLSEQFTVIAVDMIGFGKSSKPVDYSYSPVNQAKTLIQLLNRLNIKEVHLVGNSFGGRVAIEMASLLGDRAHSLTLVASAGGGSDAPLPMRLLTLPVIGKFFNKLTIDSHTIGWKSIFVNKEKICQERIDEKFKDALLPGAQSSALATFKTMMDIRGFKRSDLKSLHRKLKELDLQTLIIWGDSDPLLPLNHAHRFQALIKNTRLDVFNQCGHAPQIEHPVKFNLALCEFTSGVISHKSTQLNADV